MKTLTELSGSVIRVAAAAMADARRSLPGEEKPAALPAAEVAPQPPEGSAPVAPCEPAAEPRESTGAPVAGEAQAAGESDSVNAALDQALADATGFTGDRLAMLRAALEAAGERAKDVRLVRVFALEEPLSGARVIGQHQYVVDFFPRDMKHVVSAPNEERGRGGGGGRRRGGGGAGAGGRGGKGSATGGFSMDSLRDDRKNERGGRGRAEGGRRPGGGGAGGRGAPAKPGGSGPKK